MKLILIIFFLSFALILSNQYSDSHSMTEKFDEYLERHQSNKELNGNVLITKGDSVIFSKSYGYSNKEKQSKNKASTKFLIGSITKPFTALAVLLLEQDGKIDLDSKLSEYFPDFKSSDKITIKQLLNHTSGLADYKSIDDWYEDSQSDKTTPYTTIKKMNGKPLLFEPGTNFRYSNVGYILLGLIIEKVSGVSFSEFVEDRILSPLKLENTGIIENNSVVTNLAEGYTTTPRESIEAEYINYNQPFSSGNMYSTTEDLLKFTKAIMNSELIPAAKTKEIFESGKYYGYGWGIRIFDGIKAYGHYGGMNGFVGAITYIPNGDYFICILTNNDNTPKVRITNDLVSILFNKDVTLPVKTDLISISDDLKNQVIGKYKIKDNHFLSIFENEGKLYLQEGNNEKHEMFPYDKYKFSFGLLEFNVVFSDIANNKAQRLEFVGSKTILTAVREE